MRIGFDIDDVLGKFCNKMVQNAFVYTRQFAKSKKGFLTPYTWVTHGMFDWTEQECKDFDNRSIKTTYKNMRINRHALQLVNLLKKDEHEIYIITRRGADGHSKKSTTIKWLKEQGVQYDKLLFNHLDKVAPLKKYKIDVLIDDNYKNCMAVEKAGITALQVGDFPPCQKKATIRLSWQEAYDKLMQMSNAKPMMERYPIIVDSDVCNEIDDEFALAYLFSFENAKIEAVTIAPHFQLNEDCKDIDIEKNIERSYNKAVEIAKITRPEVVSKIYKGDISFQGFGKWGKSEAVEKIIEICRNNEKVIFVGLGAPTNLAHALKLAPDIADKIKLFALMGEIVPNALTNEFNMSQDFLSTKDVLSKIKDKHIFPATGFSNLLFSAEDMKTYMDGKDNKVLKLLFKDFAVNAKEKFHCRYKSIFDIIVPYYLAHPLMFVETKASIKTNNTHVLFKKSKNFAYFPTNIIPDMVIKDFYKRMEKFEIKRKLKGKRNEN